MIRNLLKQIWASKKVNGWIFLEMMVIFIAIWLVLDPVYTTLYQIKMFDVGFDSQKMYVLHVETDRSDSPEGQDGERQVFSDSFNTLMQLLREYPGVVSATPLRSQYMWSGSYTSTLFINLGDTSKTGGGQVLECFKGEDYFRTFRFRDATTGTYTGLDAVPYEPGGVFITENLEERLFGKGNGVGKRLSRVDQREQTYRVLRVLENGRNSIDEQAGSFCVFYMGPYSELLVSDPQFQQGWHHIAFRIHEKEDETLFVERFKNEMLPRLAAGNLYVADMASMQKKYRENFDYDDLSGNMKLQLALVAFFLLNISIAVFATFWLRVRKRRGDVGVMLALGSTGKGIKKYFLMESLLLFGCSAMVGILILGQIVYLKGGLYALTEFSAAEKLTTVYREGWPINHPAAHFIFVTLFTLVILGGTILLGTWLPALRASRIRPADALREE